MNKPTVSIDMPGQVPVTRGGLRVRVFDTTLRDGEQTPGVEFSLDDKLAIASSLEGIGVDTIEAGFPASSPSEVKAVSAVAGAVEQAEVAALARCIPDDIEAAAAALRSARKPVLHLVYGTSDIHLARKYRVNRAEALRRIHRSVSMAATHSCEVQFSLEDATRSDRAFVRQVIQTALSGGATRINVPDTIGIAMPDEYASLVADALQIADGRAIVAAHCHDDLGMATANTISAIRAGATQVEVTVNGIGERAGNAALEEIAIVAAVKEVARTRIRLDRLQRVSRFVAECSGVPVQPNKAVVGEHAFAHSSGIHQDALIKDSETYECFKPGMVGVDGHSFVLTTRSGRAAIAHEMRARGHDPTPDEVDEVYRRFVETDRETVRGEDSGKFDRVLSAVMGTPAQSSV